jgi:hypothetical protein
VFHPISLIFFAPVQRTVDPYTILIVVFVRVAPTIGMKLMLPQVINRYDMGVPLPALFVDYSRCPTETHGLPQYHNDIFKPVLLGLDDLGPVGPAFSTEYILGSRSAASGL